MSKENVYYLIYQTTTTKARNSEKSIIDEDVFVFDFNDPNYIKDIKNIIMSLNLREEEHIATDIEKFLSEGDVIRAITIFNLFNRNISKSTGLYSVQLKLTQTRQIVKMNPTNHSQSIH